MNVIDSVVVFLFHLHIFSISAQNDKFVRTDQQLRFDNNNARYINHGDKVVLYNVHHQSAIISRRKSGSSYINIMPSLSDYIRDETSFQSELKSHRSADHIFQVFTILRAVERKE